MRGAWLGSAGILLAVFGFWATSGTRVESQALPKDMPIVGANPQAGTLNATLWMRTSGEYRAICLQTYRLAAEALERRVEKERAGGETDSRPLAVILDLDETVLDNSLFQSRVILRGERFSDEAFNRWINEDRQEVELVPGARGFIETCVAKGVRAYFMSNRPRTELDSTMDTLRRLGVAAGDELAERLLLREDSSLKDPRRNRVAASHRVIMAIGDNLGDFSDEFNSRNFQKSDDPIGARLRAVDRRLEKWGVEWFVLPNPVYGDWTRPIDWKNPEKPLMRRGSP